MLGLPVPQIALGLNRFAQLGQNPDAFVRNPFPPPSSESDDLAVGRNARGIDNPSTISFEIVAPHSYNSNATLMEEEATRRRLEKEQIENEAILRKLDAGTCEDGQAKQEHILKKLLTIDKKKHETEKLIARLSHDAVGHISASLFKLTAFPPVRARSTGATRIVADVRLVLPMLHVCDL